MGIIVKSDSSARLYENRNPVIPHARLEIKNTSRTKRWLYRLRKAGVTRAVLPDELYDKLAPGLLKCGIQPISGNALVKRLAPSIGLFALDKLNVPLNSAGAEIYSGGADAADAVEQFSKRLRYVSVIGRMDDDMPNINGVSVIRGNIPDGMCNAYIRLYADREDLQLSVKCGSREAFLKSVEICIPEEYSGICPGNCALSFGEALVQSGKLRPGDIRIKDAVFI